MSSQQADACFVLCKYTLYTHHTLPTYKRHPTHIQQFTQINTQYTHYTLHFGTIHITQNELTAHCTDYTPQTPIHHTLHIAD